MDYYYGDTKKHVTLSFFFMSFGFRLNRINAFIPKLFSIRKQDESDESAE